MEEMLHLAKKDFDIALLLYNEKEYSNALYHYHQCVEKTVNYIGLSTGIISEEQLIKEIRHNPIDVFMILFNHISEQYKELIPHMDPNIFITNAKQIIRTKSEELLVSQVINSIKEICNEKELIDVNKFPSKLDALSDFVSKFLPNLVNVYTFNSEPQKQYVSVILDEKINNSINFINNGIKILWRLLMNSLICSKYTPDSFRNYSSKIGNPVEYFNESNPIIVGLPFLLETMNIPILFAGKINWKQIV